MGGWVGGWVGLLLATGYWLLATGYWLLAADQVLVVRVEHDGDGDEVEAVLHPVIGRDGLGHLELLVRQGDDHGERVQHDEHHLRSARAQAAGRGVAGFGARGCRLRARGREARGCRVRLCGLQGRVGRQGGERSAHVDDDAEGELDRGDVVEGGEVVHRVGDVAAAEPLEHFAQPAAVVLLVPG